MANRDGHRRFGNVRKLPSGRYQIRFPARMAGYGRVQRRMSARATLIGRSFDRSDSPAARAGRTMDALTWASVVERVTGIEPALSAWEAVPSRLPQGLSCKAGCP
jgi:hypothetical protein